ncbi:YceI family protein [Pinirhizobacter soli]|uniref:YceI family protein n=1 Tax=Pinirhizobacter soli TaxID=2786953 RepID=UPI00202A29C1|nr:YceI family protein [Pinirhizobacter soli]
MILPIKTMPAVIAFLALSATASAAADPPKAEDASAVAQYQQLHLTKDPSAALAGTYKLDPHHASVIAKLAHMDLSRYTLRFNEIAGSFNFDPSTATATHLDFTINPASVDTGDAAFDKRIADKYFEAPVYPAIHFTADSVKIVGDHASVQGILEFHGVKKPVMLQAVYRGFAQSRIGFSGEASFKRSQFGVGQWVPLEADDVTILVEMEFIRQ